MNTDILREAYEEDHLLRLEMAKLPPIKETTVKELRDFLNHKCVEAGKKGEEGWLEAKLWANLSGQVKHAMILKQIDEGEMSETKSQ